MTRALDSAVQADFQGSKPKPVLLFDIVTGKTPANVRFTSFDRAITFGSNVYSPRRCELDEARVQGTSQASSLRVRVDDGDGTFATLVAGGANFQNQRCRVHRTNVGSTGGAGSNSMLDVYIVDFYERTGKVFSFTLRPLTSVFDVEVPVRELTLEEFPTLPEEAG